ncbi:transposase for IS1272 [Staphylococcus aureus]|nr:transposase for IS1272 [Staphylococcus aureus]
MYKNYNMTQLTLPIETSVRIPQNDISRYVNEIVETIPDSEFDEFRHHRGATSYHPKMMLKIILYAYTQSVFSGIVTRSSNVVFLAFMIYTPVLGD